MWEMRSDKWHKTYDRWQVKCAMNHVTSEMWHMTHDIFSVLFGVGATIGTRWETQCLQNAGFLEKSVNSVNKIAIAKAAQAAQALSKI